jgi:hypothetical protein
MSPRRNSTGSRAFIVHQLELPSFEILQEGPRIAAPRRVVGGKLLAPFRRFSPGEGLAQKLPGQRGSGFPRPLGVSI